MPEEEVDLLPGRYSLSISLLNDVGQTEGAELPDLQERVKGEAGESLIRLLTFTMVQGIELEFKDLIAPALGMSYGGRIVLLPGQEPAEQFSTLIRELAHEMLPKAERRTATTKTVRETKAEAIAFVVSQAIVLDSGRASADYIHLYHGNAALLTESLEVIQRTSALILSAIEPEQVEPETDKRQQGGEQQSAATPKPKPKQSKAMKGKRKNAPEVAAHPALPEVV